MNRRAVEGALGRLLLLCAAALVAPTILALAMPGAEPARERWSFVGTTVAAGALGALFVRLGRGADEADLGPREGYAVVTFGWLLFSLVGCMPFVGAAHLSVTDAFFETMSGFTTTGASILSGDRIDSLSLALHLWRSLTQWLGGLGIVVLSVAVLPALGTRGSSLVRSEFSGHQQRIRPRIASTARLLWGLYAAITAAVILLLWIGPCTLHEAVCHAFTSLSGGGFSTRGASIAGFQSAYVEWVLVGSMVAGGTNFALLYAVLVQWRWRRGWTDPEWRLYLGLAALASALICVGLWAGGQSFEAGIRHAVFQVASILTTTGYGTDDYTLWAPGCQGVLLTLFFVGGCVGSTGGSVKVARVMLALQVAVREVRQMLRPRAVIPLRVGGQPIERDTVTAAVGYLVVYGLTVVVGAVCLAWAGAPETLTDPVTGRLVVQDASSQWWTSLTASLTCAGNTGPGFGAVGPSQNFAGFSDLGKWICACVMLLGRLEIYSVLLLLLPATWKR